MSSCVKCKRLPTCTYQTKHRTYILKMAPSVSRFANVTQTELLRLQQKLTSKMTDRSTKFGVNLLRKFLEASGYSSKVEEITPQELNKKPSRSPGTQPDDDMFIKRAENMTKITAKTTISQKLMGKVVCTRQRTPTALLPHS